MLQNNRKMKGRDRCRKEQFSIGHNHTSSMRSGPARLAKGDHIGHM